MKERGEKTNSVRRIIWRIFILIVIFIGILLFFPKLQEKILLNNNSLVDNYNNSNDSVQYTSNIKYINPITYTSSYDFRLDFGDSNVDILRVYVPTPAEWDSQKNVSLLDYNHLGIIHSNRNYNNWYIQYNKSALNNNVLSTKQIFSFTCYEIKTDISIENIALYDTSSNLYKDYTKNESMIETDFFRNITPSIIGNETNPIKKAKKIYDYVVDNMNYSTMQGKVGGAQFAYTNKTGECGEYSALFVAMARSIGIPARPIVGFWANTTYGNTHVWAEFYIQNVGWIPVDPTIAQQNSKNRKYYFGNMDNKRLIMSKNFNILLDKDIAGLFQIGAYWWWGKGEGVVGEVSYKNPI